MAHLCTVRTATLLLAAAVTLLPACARLGSAPAEPLAEDIPLTPGVTVQGSWSRSGSDAAGVQASLAEQQSRELDRRIRELRRQQGELEKLKDEIKAILQSAPRQP